ncbi:hypothetical protein ACP4OV_027480 [Aristida adscensionis]
MEPAASIPAPKFLILVSTMGTTTPHPSGVLLLCLLLLLCVARAADSVSREQPLSGGQKLVSKGGKFALGFFQPDGSVPGKWYLAIWYNKISKLTPVWIANRETPISNPSSSELKISEDGNIVLLDQLETPIWSTKITNNASNSTIGIILDTGNFVLTHASNLSNFLWQSFDEPANVWLPRAKLGRNKLTGVGTRYISWQGSTDPSPGFYTLEMDPNGSNQYINRWNTSDIYWESGTWTGTMFVGIPEMASYPKSLLNYQYVSNDQEDYFVYLTNEEKGTAMFVMEVSGQLKAVSWIETVQDWVPFLALPKAQCSVHFVCGSFAMCSENSFTFCSCVRGFTKQYEGDWLYGNPHEGCTRNARLQCGSNGSSSSKSEKDGFYALAVAMLPDKAWSVAATDSDGCKASCLNNCSCAAYHYSDHCSLWYGDLTNLVAPTDGLVGQNIYVRLAASEFSNTRKLSKAVIIGAGAGGAIIVTTIVIISVILIFRKGNFGDVNKVEGSLVVFKYRYLQSVTKNFSEKLGKGAFGSVYKGMSADGKFIAVKKLDSVSQGEKQFRAEVSTIGTIQHVNLIRLFGFCSEQAEKILVYEYMVNGSLDKLLFGSTLVPLSWKQRHQIALGVAKGLAYLHEKCRNRIIHCDIKPENVLLDESFAPKIADFGLAKLVGRDFSRVLTTMRGTIGYLAPEWISGTAITDKADVFSYGMMLFEIISGNRNSAWRQEGVEIFFPVLVAKRLPEGKIEDLLNPEVIKDANLQEVERACKVACWCVQDDENKRPTMGEIVQILEGLLDIDLPPIPAYLQVLAENSKFSSAEASY